MLNLRTIPEGTPLNSPIYVVHHLESRLVSLDEQQQEVAFQYPDGPQRIRGLAGTGKTVTFAQRAARIHKEHPDWKIAFVFFTRSLYEQITQERISTYYKELSEGQEPNWDNLNVLHAWGAKDRDGFYRNLAQKCGVKPLSVRDVENIFGRKVSPSIAFKYICDQLEKKITDYPKIYDVILIDEGQDLPLSFYRLARNVLNEPKRLYWAYDEAQGIGSLIVPNSATTFGRNPDGSLVVDIRGRAKDFNKSYRTPKKLLMIAHAVNMGLLREEGVLQGVSQKTQWEKLGYTVLEGDFRSNKELIKIEREYDQTKKDPKPLVNTHPIDQSDFPHQDAIGDILKFQSFETEKDEQEWIAQQVANDLRQGLQPIDIIITALCGDSEKLYFQKLKQSLSNYGITAYIAGVDDSRDIFQKDGCVTISNVYRAKGNEAYKVYSCRFHYATQPLKFKEEESEVHKRNEAFVAITRAKVWCVITGLESPIFDELRQYKEQFPYLIFPAFNQSSPSLQRVTDDIDE
ncbi:AAA family ATPase [Nostoc sp. FACHB-87]|uniref:DEAD/DEAH box helicase n=1 Tax=Nostocaceae TaxID=1162 RepID=UPI001685EF1C|nr:MULTISPECIES: DEAD/DEAH box helicase family protein [Nostocaceae]MBD2452620.1 AAA family ATPase [Nostoc sp. FACHB-87]MBD2473551.1 AAA family ATPase [Anabaena sp. FACHB-83]